VFRCDPYAPLRLGRRLPPSGYRLGDAVHLREPLLLTRRLDRIVDVLQSFLVTPLLLLANVCLHLPDLLRVLGVVESLEVIFPHLTPLRRLIKRHNVSHNSVITDLLLDGKTHRPLLLETLLERHCIHSVLFFRRLCTK
jgi:hypothetical protein